MISPTLVIDGAPRWRTLPADAVSSGAAWRAARSIGRLLEICSALACDELVAATSGIRTADTMLKAVYVRDQLRRRLRPVAIIGAPLG